MKRSTDRSLTTHAASLPRPPELLASLCAATAVSASRVLW
jgi:hypothetical protein